MRVSKKSNLVYGLTKNTKYQGDLDNDVKQLVVALSGKIRFGVGDDGTVGENISGQFQQFTSHATPDTEFSVAHTLGAIPVGAITLWQDKAGSLYQSPTSGTEWTSTNVYFKCNVASVAFKVFLLK